MQYFVAVAEEGQITRAAERLHIAQPALSQAIAQLEADLGVSLLDRHARGVSLTPAGERLLAPARRAVDAWGDAAETARALARADRGAIDFGFVGAPPGLDSPDALEHFAAAHPGITLRYVELPFPARDTAAWLSETDIAVCHSPPAHPGVWSRPIRREPRAVLLPLRHRLSAREELRLEDVLGEEFIGMDPRVDPGWAGFWSLDDHRFGATASLTADSASNPHEVLAALAVRDAITTVPSSVAGLIMNAVPGVVPIPLLDAEPCTIQLVGHRERRNQLVTALLDFSRAELELQPDQRFAARET